MQDDIAKEMYLTVRASLLRRFEQEKIDVQTNTKVLEFKEDGIVCEKDGETAILDGYDSIILALGSKKYNPLEDAEELAPEVYTIGDAKQARSALEAIYEGARLALTL